MHTYWQHEITPRSATLPEHAGVAVIGAGISGLSAAIALVDAGEDVVVIERGAVGAGASTRNAGYLMRGAADNYSAAVRDLGREGARTLWEATEGNLADLVRLGVEALPSFERRPSTLLAFEGGEADDLRTSAALMREDGFETETLDGGDDALWTHRPALTALVNPNDAVINPAQLIAWLRAKVSCPVMEHAAVFDLHANENAVVVRTAQGDVRAERVLVCTNAWASRLVPGLSVVPNRGQMLALRVPSGVRLEHAYYANRGSEYFRRASPDAVVVGGWRKHYEIAERTSIAGITPEVQAGLETFAASVLGKRYEVTHRWGGIMAFTPDGLPRVGPISSEGRVWCCAGFAGHGMSLAHRTATLGVGAMLTGAPIPAWARKPSG